MMGALAASIAHEINQLLTALVANAYRRWLENGRDLSRANESLNRVIGEANRAARSSNVSARSQRTERQNTSS
jgi:hypothetical protein